MRVKSINICKTQSNALHMIRPDKLGPRCPACHPACHLACHLTWPPSVTATYLATLLGHPTYHLACRQQSRPKGPDNLYCDVIEMQQKLLVAIAQLGSPWPQQTISSQLLPSWQQPQRQLVNRQCTGSIHCDVKQDESQCWVERIPVSWNVEFLKVVVLLKN